MSTIFDSATEMKQGQWAEAMRVIHFTQGATDKLTGFGSSGARFVPLADGTGDSHVSCLHLEEGARVNAPAISHAAALLVVHGRITITTHLDARIQFSGGMGTVFADHERYTIESATGAIVLVVEAADLKPHARGISTPQRIAGQRWPSASLLTTPGGTWPRSELAIGGGTVSTGRWEQIASFGPLWTRRW
jgi:hypothetical protein